MASTAGTHIQTEELIQLRLQARGLSLQSRCRASSAISGMHQSRFRSRGIDFQESRSYQPGDDIRAMDWRVTARTGKPHTKLYREERERPVIVMVDLGPSMFFGTRVAFKSVIAARAAALIGWTAINHGDRIGAFLFGAGKHQEIPASGGRRGVLRLIRALAAWSSPDNASPSEGLGATLARLRRVARPGSLIFILSDFYTLDEDSERHLTRLRLHNDIVACQINDALELEPPPPGRYGITDGIHSGILDTGTISSRARYQTHFSHHHQRVRELLTKRAVPLIRLLTHEDVLEGLRRGLSNPTRS